METIISAAISGGAALIVCIITQSMQAKKTEALIEYRLKMLEEKVDKHNNLIDRTYKLEERTELQEAELHRQNERLKILEANK